ncbi:Guanylate kinase [Planctomycetales bacterium 10988]|nr:Guanylate kinase [Planctomycetales bacterium 10988]
MTTHDNQHNPLSETPVPGKLVIISGPSGSGKSTILRQVMQICPLPLVFSVSATTRTPRPQEQDGVHYYFLSPEKFQQKQAAGEFLECFEVYGKGYWYGTLWSEVQTNLERGQWVVLEIDVQGALEVLHHYPAAITIFVMPQDREVLETRLKARATESPEQMARRLEAAHRELDQADRYQYQVINDQVDRAVREICDILQKEAEPISDLQPGMEEHDAR